MKNNGFLHWNSLSVLWYNVLQGKIKRENLPSQYVHIKRKKYAAGLVWQPMVSGFTPRAYAYTLARGIDHRLNRFISYSGIKSIINKHPFKLLFL